MIRKPRKRAMYCLGCGSTETLEQIRAKHPGAIACCPERRMVYRRDKRQDTENLTPQEAEILADVMAHHPTLTREEALKHLRLMGM